MTRLEQRGAVALEQRIRAALAAPGRPGFHKIAAAHGVATGTRSGSRSTAWLNSRHRVGDAHARSNTLAQYFYWQFTS
jgi:hypothetical protein